MLGINKLRGICATNAFSFSSKLGRASCCRSHSYVVSLVLFQEFKIIRAEATILTYSTELTFYFNSFGNYRKPKSVGSRQLRCGLNFQFLNSISNTSIWWLPPWLFSSLLLVNNVAESNGASPAPTKTKENPGHQTEFFLQGWFDVGVEVSGSTVWRFHAQKSGER